MKVDWQRPELAHSFASMESTMILNPSTGQGVSNWRGGQYFAATPDALAEVEGQATVHADQNTGEEYVKVSGYIITRPRHANVPFNFIDHDYWSYGYTGWPIIAAVPGDPFNGLTSDSSPENEHGGREIPLVGGFDPDGDLPPLLSYPKNGGDPIALQGYREGPVVGGAGPEWFEEQGPDPPLPHFTYGNSGWNFKAVSQRCWVLIVMDPSAHGFYRHTGPPPASDWDGDPVVIHPQLPPPYLSPFASFNLIWRRGPGSGLAGEFEATQGSGGTPTTVTVAPPSRPAGRVWTQEEISALAQAHGAPDPLLASAVAMAESSGREDATNVNADGSEDIGLWQLNSVHGYPRERLFDADFNAEAAREVSDNWTDWSPWVTFNNGAYLDFYG